MFRVVCILSLLGLALGDTLVLNQAIDQVLSGLDAWLLENGRESIPIEDMNNDFKYKLITFYTPGHSSCRDGYVRSFATLKRNGDVVVSASGNTATLDLQLSMDTLEFGFNACQVEVEPLFNITRPMHASVSSNSIAAQVTLVKNGNQCIATVNNAGLNNIGEISVKSGGGRINKIEDLILDWFTKHFHNKVVNAVNEKLLDGARAHVEEMDLCSKIPF